MTNYPLGGLRQAEAMREDNDRGTDFIKLAALIATSQDFGDAASKAAAQGQSDRIVRVLKAAQAAGTTGNTGPDYTYLHRAFINSARSFGAFDQIASAAYRVGLGTRRVAIFTTITAGAVTEGSAKPSRRIQLTASEFTPSKVAVQVVCTKELLDAMTAEGLNALGRELRAAVAVGSDSEFLSALSGNSSEGQGVDSFQGFVDDVEELLRLLELGVSSRPFLIVTPEVAKAVALQAQTAGVTTLTWNGGTIAGVPILVSEAQSPDRVSAVDASAIAVALEEINLRSSRIATVELDTAPTGSAATPTATSQVSLFQTNSVALRCERSFAVKALRGTAFAHLTGVAIGETSASPAVA